MIEALGRLLRIENVWVLGLLLVAVLVALEARWRGDARMGGAARAIKIAIRAGFIALVAAILLFFGALFMLAPIGP
jgi:hypothetical protein